MEYLLPRFPGEKNGGKASFLAESSSAIFGRDRKTGEPILAPVALDAKKKNQNPTKAYLHFWEQVQAAFDATRDKRLAAMLAFKQHAIAERDGLLFCDSSFLRMRAKDKGPKKGEVEFVANTGADDGSYVVVEKATFGFSVDGVPVTLDDVEDPLRRYWFDLYTRLAFADEDADEPDSAETTTESTGSRATLCLVTGRTGQSIARSHKPKILGVPGIAIGGYIVSFAKAAPAFSSYGFEMGENAPVSETAAASYALALTELLKDDDQHLNLGPVAVCSWAKGTPQTGRQFNRLLNRAYPSHVRNFLRAPFAGDMDRAVLNQERLYTVALSGNAGRIVIQHWLDQSLADAIEHFRLWWNDLQITPPSWETERTKREKGEAAEGPPSSFAIPNLARVMLRQSKDQEEKKLVSARIVQLYRTALEGTAPPLMLLKPILDEFHTALVKRDPKNDPFKQSRFALVKLILLRFFRSQNNRKEGDFMPTPQLADTPEPAYNLGRLLAVFESLQDRYHNFEKKGAGVVERFYGSASSAPAAVFPQLCRLARHHLSKVRKEDESSANRLDQAIGEILKKFQPDRPGESPHFKRILTLPEQGIFALGFYQQRAYDRACSLVLSNLGKARQLREKKQPHDAPLTKARDFANEFGYDDLIAAVSQFESQT